MCSDPSIAVLRPHRTPVRSRFRRVWLGVVVSAGSGCLISCSDLPTRARVLATFHVASSSWQAEEKALVDTLLARVPIGSLLPRVTAVLDSLQYVEAQREFSKPSYRVDTLRPESSGARVAFVMDSLRLDTANGRALARALQQKPMLFVDSSHTGIEVQARAPYRESYFKITNYVCENSLVVTFAFDAKERLKDVRVSSGGACI
jgi:hypothetical protein